MDDPMKTFPRARVSNLVMKEMPDEVLIYDLTHHKAHCLNQSAALIWQHCDGATSISILAQLLSENLQAPVDEEIVWTAVQELSLAQLLERPYAPPAQRPPISRRQALRKLSWTAAMVPMITSIVAPTAQAAGTCTGTTERPIGAACELDCQCASGFCSGSPGVCATPEI
jgi:hypothetical protein